MIDIQNLKFGYVKSWPVFSNFTMRLEEGNVYGLLGKNGTGKSTLLYLLCGLLRPQKGKIYVDGFEAKQRKADMLREIMFVPEEYELPSISLASYVAINAPFYPNFSMSALTQNLQEFELPEKINLGKLSMGQKKKVIISFALAARTKYLFLDEPTNGLDIPSKAQFRRVVASNMNSERTVIISTHQVRDVEMLIDHVVMISRHEVLLNTSIEALSRNLRFEIRPSSSELQSDVLYAEPSLQGNYVIARGESAADGAAVNLELLFNAVTSGALREVSGLSLTPSPYGDDAPTAPQNEDTTTPNAR